MSTVTRVGIDAGNGFTSVRMRDGVEVPVRGTEDALYKVITVDVYDWPRGATPRPCRRTLMDAFKDAKDRVDYLWRAGGWTVPGTTWTTPGCATQRSLAPRSPASSTRGSAPSRYEESDDAFRARLDPDSEVPF